MSRQELAEAVNAYLWTRHGRRVSLDGNYVGKLERGEHRWPGDLYREAFRAVLNAARDADLGFYIIRTVPTEFGGQIAVEDPGSSAVPVVDRLRTALSVYRPLTEAVQRGRPLAAVEAAAAQVHRLYQCAEYEAAAQLLADLVQDAHVSVMGSSGDQRRQNLRNQAVTYIAASKLACKAGDGQLAWLAADRATTAAHLAEATALSAAAAYQVACAFLRFPDQRGDAEDLAVATAEGLAPSGYGSDADSISARGSLLLLAALVAAQRQDSRAAGQYLAQAAALAGHLGRDDNRLWTAFGPTNVAIHEVSIAVALGRLDRAVEIGERLDTSRLPSSLAGRRAQVHLDLAAAYAQQRSGDSVAVLHLLEAERVAPQTVRVNIAARTLLAELLRRGRRAATPGLRPLAERAGVAV